MAFRPSKKNPQFGSLKANLTQVQTEDNALYQVIQRIIERLTQFQTVTEGQIADIKNSTSSAPTTASKPPENKSYITFGDETENLPNSYQLLAGTNVTFDTTVPTELTIHSVGGGGASEPHAPTHSVGNTDPVSVLDLAGYTGVADRFLNGDGEFTTVPATALGSHAVTHSNGSADPVIVTNLAGFPGGTTTFLRADRTFVAPPTGGIPSAHAPTHQDGGTDELALDGSQITTGIVADARLSSNVALENVANVFTNIQQAPSFAVSQSTPHIVFNETDQPLDLKRFQILGESQLLIVRTLNDAGSTELSRPLTITRPGDLSIQRDIYEKNRASPMGHWIDEPYSAAKFTAGAMTWTVGAGNVNVNRYTLIGKTLLWMLNISASTLSGTPDGELRIVIPNGLTGIVGRGNTNVTNLSDGALQRGLLYVASSTTVAIQKNPYANYTLNSGVTALAFEVFLEIL